MIDRLFSRVGAADDLARGRSTFMVEMTETAAILHQAGPRSLVVVDEIGRGTATLDGLAIAWAVLEALHGAIRCRTIFATHFHELAELSDRMPRMKPHTMRVKEWKRTVVFLHEVAEGAAKRSWGVHVAELAGVPAPVVRRAGTLLSSLEKHNGPLGANGPLAALPLFVAAASPENEATQSSDQPESSCRCVDRAGAGSPHPAGGARRALSVEGAAAGFRRKLLIVRSPLMLTPAPLPASPDAAASVLAEALTRLGNERAAPRDAVIVAFRRHLARIQNHVQTAFEQDQITGLQAARCWPGWSTGW